MENKTGLYLTKAVSYYVIYTYSMIYYMINFIYCMHTLTGCLDQFSLGNLIANRSRFSKVKTYPGYYITYVYNTGKISIVSRTNRASYSLPPTFGNFIDGSVCGIGARDCYLVPVEC